MLDDLPLFNQSNSEGLAVIEPLQNSEILFLDEEVYKNRTQHHAMFSDELFPTPDEVIDQMLTPFIIDDPDFRRYGKYLRCGNEILDPSAGKGHIFDYIKEHYCSRDIDFVACEIEQDLRYVLSEKDYIVIGTDWMEFDEPRQFHCILMNPPFSDGVRHLLKAWHHCAPDGDIVCLLNAESINNPFTNQRKELRQIIDLWGSTEFIGQAFKRSERRTEVEVVIVRLHKPESATRLEFEGVNFEQDIPFDYEGFNEAPLAHRDAIKTLVSHYKRAREILVRRYQVQAELEFCLIGSAENSYALGEIFRCENDLTKQLNALKARFWQTLFDKTQIAKMTTSGFQRDFSDFERSQKLMAFTESNILEVLEIFFLNRVEIMQNCIVEVFDKLTEYHDNRLGEGWKTNSAFQVNKKLIFPWVMNYDPRWGFRINYGWREDLFNDLDKIMMYISGDRNICYITTAIQRQLDRSLREAPKIESSYFKIQFFKKGTVHLWFLDEGLWKEFNRRAAIGKKWIGTEESAFTNSQKKWSTN